MTDFQFKAVLRMIINRLNCVKTMEELEEAIGELEDIIKMPCEQE